MNAVQVQNLMKFVKKAKFVRNAKKRYRQLKIVKSLYKNRKKMGAAVYSVIHLASGKALKR